MNNPPETCDQRAADMWSFAIILWELATREVPFAELSPMEMGMKVSVCPVYSSKLPFGNFSFSEQLIWTLSYFMFFLHSAV